MTTDRTLHQIMRQHHFPSPAARAFIDTALAAPKESLSIGNIGLVREQNRAAYAPASHQAVSRYAVAYGDCAIDGMTFMEVKPTDAATDLTIFYCFGGGMITGSPFEDLPITAALARKAKATIDCPYYRLAPEHPFPAAAEDVLSAYRSVAARQDGRPVVLAGESAGGNLALFLLQHLVPHERPRAIALMSPWCDLAHQGESITVNAGRDPTLTPDDLRRCAEAYAAGRDFWNPAISPLYGPFDSTMPPAMLTTGTRDLLMSDSVRLAAIMRQAGMAAELRIWEGLWHVFEFYDIPEAHHSLAQIAGFLRHACGQSLESTDATAVDR